MNKSLQIKTVLALFGLLSAVLGTFSTQINAEEIVTIHSAEVINAYPYGEFAQMFEVYEDADNAIIPVEDIPYLAHYENNNKGEFVFQEWLVNEDEATVNEFEDQNEY